MNINKIKKDEREVRKIYLGGGDKVLMPRAPHTG